MKKLFSLMTAMILCIGAINAADSKIYCKVAQGWWKASGAAVAAYAWKGEGEGTVNNAAWPGVRMEAVAGEADVWSIDLDRSQYEKIIFVRVNGSGTVEDWGAKTADLTFPADDKDLYTITSETPIWGNPGVAGEWSKFVAAPGEGGGETPDPEAAKFYVTGDSALVVDAGLDKGKAWNADAIKSTKDTAVLNLKANQDYVLKVVVNDNWLGYDKLSEVAFGLKDLGGNNHNIGFKLNNAGEVKVIYFVKDEQVTFKLLGDFATPKMEIAGGWDEWAKHDMTLSGDKKTAVYEVELTAGDFNFKLIKDGAWISKANGGAAYGLHRDWPGVAGVKDVDSDELKLTADVDGKYIFTFTFENDSIGITFPEKGETPDPEAAKFYVTGDSALVVDAGLDKGKAWNADAIKSTKDTAVLNLKANQYYRLKVVVGTNWLGYDKLTEAAEGLEDLTTDNHNIGFKLNNAGEVKVIYFVKDAQVTFKLLGDFQVAAAPKMEIAGGWDEWTKHDMTLSGDNKTAVYELNLTAGDYNFKLIKDGAWISKANDGAPFGLHRDFPGVAGVKDVDSDNLKLTADVDGKYIFTWTFANDSIGITFPEKGDVPPVGPELADGFYLIGQNGWDVAALSASLKFEKNLGAENEYQLSVTLVEGQPIKVVYVENNAIKDWYPVGKGNEYVVAAEHAGNKIIYFNPSKNGEWSLLDGYIYIADGGETAITNIADGIKAVKVLRDGQILIIKGEKTFNVQGQIVR